MCDYSLMPISHRLAQQGEELVTHRFETGSVGLASPSDLQLKPDLVPVPRRSFWSFLREIFAPPEGKPLPAVCIPPGARLLLQSIPEHLQDEIGVGPAEEVTFTQITAAANRYRDAVRFRNGREILLQLLREGQRVNVLAVASEAESDAIGAGEQVLVRR